MSNAKIKVGILRGGDSKHYTNSLEKGAAVISHLHEDLSEKYKPIDIFVDKDHVFHMSGLPVEAESLHRRVDVIWDTTKHPEISQTLNDFSVPTIGQGAFFHALENNRDILSKHAKDAGIKTTRSIVLPVFQKDFDARPDEHPFGQGDIEKYAAKKAKEVWQKFPAPWIVKSYTVDSTMGIHLAKTFHELVRAIEDGVNHGNSILVEEFISGRVGSLHLVPKFRNQEYYIILPENFSSNENNIFMDIAQKLHDHLGVKHYLKIDFVFHPRLGFHLLSIDGSPDMREGSHFWHSCKRLGAEMSHVIEHILRSFVK